MSQQSIENDVYGPTHCEVPIEKQYMLDDDSDFTLPSSSDGGYSNDVEESQSPYEEIYFDELDEECHRDDSDNHSHRDFIDTPVPVFETEYQLREKKKCFHRLNICNRHFKVAISALCAVVAVSFIIAQFISSESIPSESESESISSQAHQSDVGVPVLSNNVVAPITSNFVGPSVASSGCPDHIVDAVTWYQTVISSPFNSITFKFMVQNQEGFFNDVGVHVWTYPTEMYPPVTMNTPIPPTIAPKETFWLHFTVDLSLAPEGTYDLSFMPTQNSDGKLFQLTMDIPVIGDVQMECH